MLRGVVGIVKWSYYNAAAIDGYTVTRDKRTGFWSMTARVVMSDPFKLRQKPLIFVAPFMTPHGKQSWEWRIEDFDLKDGQMTARLEPLGSMD